MHLELVPRLTADETLFRSYKPICSLGYHTTIVLGPELLLKPPIDLLNLIDEGFHLMGIVCVVLIVEIVQLDKAADGEMARLDE